MPRPKSLVKLKDTLRANGQSLPAIIANLNRALRGWYEYFKHSHRTTFAPLGSWIRLRSILRRR